MKPISKEEAIKEAIDIISIYQTKLGLEQWTLKVQYDKNDNEAYATTTFESDDYKVATISITKEHLSCSPRDRFQTIIHELYHIVLGPLTDHFKMIITATSEMLAKIAKSKEEEVIEHLARNYVKNETFKY